MGVVCPGVSLLRLAWYAVSPRGKPRELLRVNDKELDDGRQDRDLLDRRDVEPDDSWPALRPPTPSTCTH